VQAVISFVLVFALLVLFHEFGHFTAAKLVGIRVHEFSVGFGPRLVKKRKGETTYSVRAVPLGGYVSLAGMDRAELEDDVVARDDPRGYYSKPTWAKLTTFAAGPFMNIVLAILLYFIIFAYAGVPVVTVADVSPGGPADRAGVQPGDLVLSVNGNGVQTALELFDTINSSPGETLSLVLSRGGSTVEVTAVPEEMPDTGEGRLGIEIGETRAKKGLLQTLWSSAAYTLEIARMIVVFLGRVLTGGAAADFSGPIGIYRVIQATAEATPTLSAFVMSIMVLAAYLSTNLALFNLLPIPILDGGWLLLIVVEAIRRKPLSVEHEAAFRFAGLVLMVILFIVVTLKDVF
jgi:regulator of sigma E protease